MKFRLGELGLLVLLFACTLVGLRYVHPLAETGIYSFTMLFALMSVLMAVARRAKQRIFWIGFSIALNAYLAFVHLGDTDGIVPRHNGPEITTQLLRVGFNWMHGEKYDLDVDSGMGGFFSVADELSGEASEESEANEGENGSVAPFPSNLSLIVGGPQEVHEQPLIADFTSISYMRIGHCFWALVLGWFGGHFTQAVYRKSRHGD